MARITFDDWHHSRCDAWTCEKAYCKIHRRIYRTCQDWQGVPSRVYCEEPPFTTMWEGNGECLSCLESVPVAWHH